MASKNSVKVYAPDSYYHIYNRGVEKRNIFLDGQDYAVFLSYLQIYLSPKDTNKFFAVLASKDSSLREKDAALKQLRLKNYYSHMYLLCYALLPNHFHLLIRQKDLVLNSFMNSLGTRYAMYFNHKHKRNGVLFQDVYKAVRVENDEQLLHVSRYIHLNPIKALNLPISRWEESLFPSSLADYLGKRKTHWITKEYLFNYFSQTNPQSTYEDFLGLPMEGELLSDVAIDLDSDSN